jgi:hypothetical protein
MATVKLHYDGKVILKDGKVSCSCCDSACCMYPAQGFLDGDYAEDDLPDEILVTYDLLTSEPFSKQSGGYYTDDATGTFFIVAYNEPTSSKTWCFCSTASPTGDQDAISSCLITGDGNLTPGDDAVEDQFESTYSIGGDTVTRVSLCVWTGSKSGGGTWTLKYNSTTAKWNLNGHEKSSGNQSSPTGTYPYATVS